MGGCEEPGKVGGGQIRKGLEPQMEDFTVDPKNNTESLEFIE